MTRSERSAAVTSAVLTRGRNGGSHANTGVVAQTLRGRRLGLVVDVGVCVGGGVSDDVDDNVDVGGGDVDDAAVIAFFVGGGDSDA